MVWAAGSSESSLSRFGDVAIRRERVHGTRVLDGLGLGRDDVCVHLVSKADGAAMVVGLDALVRVGEGVLARGPVNVRVAHATVVSVFIPRSVLGGVESPVDGVRVLRGGLMNPIMAFATSVSALAPDDLGSFAVYYVERLLQEMVLCLAVEAQRLRQLRSGRDAFEAARAIIAAQCTDAELRAENIARDVRLSLRQLQRVFSARGTTIDREVRRARVRYAVDLLSDPQYASLSIAQIANYSGYVSRASLTRAMAAEGFGTPTAHRGRARRSPHSPKSPEAPNDVRQTTF